MAWSQVLNDVTDGEQLTNIVQAALTLYDLPNLKQYRAKPTHDRANLLAGMISSVCRKSRNFGKLNERRVVEAVPALRTTLKSSLDSSSATECGQNGRGRQTFLD
jgi:hypothetical protein